MSLKPLTNGYVDVKQRLELLRQRQRDIELGDYFTAFVMDKIRQDESNAYGKHEWEKKNNKLKGED